MNAEQRSETHNNKTGIVSMFGLSAMLVMSMTWQLYSNCNLPMVCGEMPVYSFYPR